MFKDLTRYQIIQIIIFLILVSFPLFYHLDVLSLGLWDEARYAVNAIEMLMNSNFLVVHYKFSPDMWGLNPPFLTWIQSFSMLLIGPSTLAARLPTAIAALFTCIMLLFMLKNIFNDYWFGIITAMVLISSSGFVIAFQFKHGARTADHDSLLTLFTTMYILFFYLYLEVEDKKKKNRNLLFFFVGITLAVLTKGIAGLFFTPALVIYAIAVKKFKWIIKQRGFYIGILIFIFVIIGYYISREFVNPGYIRTVINSQTIGRYFKTIDGHKHGFLFYYKNITYNEFLSWYLFVPIGLFFGFLHKEKKSKKFLSHNIINNYIFIFNSFFISN